MLSKPKQPAENDKINKGRTQRQGKCHIIEVHRTEQYNIIADSRLLLMFRCPTKYAAKHVMLLPETGNPAFECLPSSTAGESMARYGSQLYSTLILECCDARETQTKPATEKLK